VLRADARFEQWRFSVEPKVAILRIGELELLFKVPLWQRAPSVLGLRRHTEPDFARCSKTRFRSE
jgi:hypothetical protein